LIKPTVLHKMMPDVIKLADGLAILPPVVERTLGQREVSGYNAR